MRRAALAAIAATVALAGCGSDGDDGRYYVELDNAFGLTEGADLKVAGVRAGQIRKLGLQRKGMRARVEIEVTDKGFGDLRADAFCEVRPQSLLGENFLDCDPGDSKKPPLPRGGTIPVQNTASTIPLDLIQNIMRRPVRERFSIFLSELGAGLAARGGDLNETIRRANPALRETNRVLKILEDERRTIRQLYQDADRVVGRLADRRKDVSRFVAEARDTARAQAKADKSLQRQFELLPTFLDELSPTMNALRRAAREQRPAVTNLGNQAQTVTRLLDALGPFAQTSRPAVRALSKTSRTARPIVKDARGPVRLLRTAARALPETTTNLAFILQQLDDPAFAVEKDSRAGRPDGGFTGLEALLRYIWAQSQAINVYDANSFNLKTFLFADTTCGSYSDVAATKKAGAERCRAWLGPNQPGITTPDPSKTTTRAAGRAKEIADDDRRRPKVPSITPRPQTDPSPLPATTTPAPAAEPAPPTISKALEDLLDKALGGDGEGQPAIKLPPLIDGLGDGRNLLDFLLAP